MLTHYCHNVATGFATPEAYANVACKSPSSKRPPAFSALTGMCPGPLVKFIAQADMPWEPVEWRLPSQMNCRKVWYRALTAVRGRSGFLLLIIARANMPWSDVWRGSRRPMDTNRCHRASQSASEVAVWHIRSRGEFHERTRTSNQSNP